MAVSSTIDFTGCFHGDDGWICPYFLSSAVKNSPANAGDTGNMGLIPGSGRCPRVENGNPLQYSCLGIQWTEDSGGLQSIVLQRAELE